MSDAGERTPRGPILGLLHETQGFLDDATFLAEFVRVGREDWRTPIRASFLDRIAAIAERLAARSPAPSEPVDHKHLEYNAASHALAISGIAGIFDGFSSIADAITQMAEYIKAHDVEWRAAPSEGARDAEQTPEFICGEPDCACALVAASAPIRHRAAPPEQHRDADAERELFDAACSLGESATTVLLAIEFDHLRVALDRWNDALLARVEAPTDSPEQT